MNSPSSSSSSPGHSASPPLLRRPGLWWTLWFLWLAVLWVLSSMRHPGPQVDIAGFDKVEHTVWFAGGGACLALALSFHRRPRIPVPVPAPSPLRDQVPPSSPGRAATPENPPLSPPWGRILLFVVITGALVGGVDEWHQSHTPGRSGLDVYDWMADLLGSLLAVPAARLARRFL